jgi:hypothetical protein
MRREAKVVAKRSTELKMKIRGMSRTRI